MVALLVFISFVILLIASVGICMARSPPKGKCILIIYGLITLFMGFLPMVIEGGSLLSVSKVSPEKI
jgi:hypothetical protein